MVPTDGILPIFGKSTLGRKNIHDYLVLLLRSLSNLAKTGKHHLEK